MTIVFAGALSHAPGIMAWTDAAPPAQKERTFRAFEAMRRELEAAKPEQLILFTSEHWANFFLDHISPFCIGRATSYSGPIEPWLKIDRVTLKGDPELATEILQECYRGDLEPGYAYEMEFDHGTMIPLHFLMPKMNLPVLPVMINTLAHPQPSVRRCMALGRVIGDVARRSTRRIGLIATGGLSHDPGERNHGVIDEDFDLGFLDAMKRGDLDKLSRYVVEDFAAAGAGTIELLSWVALAAAIQGGRQGDVFVYEPIKQWAAGIGAMTFGDYPTQ
jgi:aromatic ring-opening dioxygenase catalytic subunit (LigB family)